MEALNGQEYNSHFQLDEGDKECHAKQAAIVSCMKRMNSSSTSNSNGCQNQKQNTSNECYLPAISAWNECVAKRVGYL